MDGSFLSGKGREKMSNPYCGLPTVAKAMLPPRPSIERTGASACIKWKGTTVRALMHHHFSFLKNPLEWYHPKPRHSNSSGIRNQRQAADLRMACLRPVLPDSVTLRVTLPLLQLTTVETELGRCVTAAITQWQKSGQILSKSAEDPMTHYIQLG